MNTVQLLQKVRTYYDRPERWTQEVGARDANGVHVSIYVPSAVCWCLLGAVGIASQGFWDRETAAEGKILYAIEDLFPDRITARYSTAVMQFNDHPNTTFEDVLAVLDRAIEIAEGEAA